MNGKSLIVHYSPKSIWAEAFRAVRTKVLYLRKGSSIKSILITSAGAGEGKSVAVANIAAVLAQTGKRVIIVDCDLRKPAQQEIFKKRKNTVGLTNFLTSDCSVVDIIQETGIPNLRLVTSGPILSNPSELLDSDRFRDALAALSSQADYIIVDSPPVLPVTDACILGSKLDGIILIVGVGKVHPEMAVKAKEHLETVNGNILGIVINRYDEFVEQSAYYHYYESEEKAAN